MGAWVGERSVVMGKGNVVMRRGGFCRVGGVCGDSVRWGRGRGRGVWDGEGVCGIGKGCVGSGKGVWDRERVCGIGKGCAE